MAKKKVVEVNLELQISKEEFLNYLKEYKHQYEYIRVSEHENYEVCLELTWQQHSEPYTQYYFMGNIVDGHLVGKIVNPNKKKDRVKKKYTFKEKSEGFGIILLFLLIVIGIPFGIIFAISRNYIISTIIGIFPLLTMIFFSIFGKGNIPVHVKNIEDLVKNAR